MKSLSKMIISSIFLVALMLANPLIGNATTTLPAKISEVFPDDGLADAIASNLNVTVDTVVTEDTLASIDLFQIQMRPVSNIEGLQYLTGATSIDLYSGGGIVDLSPLSELNNLTRLDISRNKITDLSPIANLTNLTSLEVVENYITDLSPLASMSKMVYFSMVNQKITNPEINYATFISIPNKIKDVDGTIVAPSTISNNGVYNSPNVEWSLTAYNSTLSYNYSKIVTIGNSQGYYSGVVTQPLKEIEVAYTADFDVDGAIVETESVQAGELVSAPANPTTKAGYTFAGWYDAKTGGNKWDFAVDKMPANDITLYAQFTIKNDNGGSATVDPTTPDNPEKHDKGKNSKTNIVVSNGASTKASIKTALPKTGDSRLWETFVIGMIFSASGLFLWKKRS